MPEPNRSRLRKLIAGAIALPVFLLLAATLYIWVKNPVFIQFPVTLIHHESWDSTKYFAEFLFGYLETPTRMIRYDHDSGVSDLKAQRALWAGHENRFDLGQLAWHEGEFEQSVEDFKAHIAENGESEEALFWLGLAHLRRAEQVNCLDPLIEVSLRNSEFWFPYADGTAFPASEVGSHEMQAMCALPIQAARQDPALVQEASRIYEKLLDRYGPNLLYHWLLNFSAMANDAFPDQVPERYRLREGNRFREIFYGSEKQRMQKKYANLYFAEVAGNLAIDWSREVGFPDAGRGIAVEDFNGDGCLDIVAGGYYTSTAYYENNCDPGSGLTFTERSTESGIAEIKGTHIITAADYDNDGWMDLFLSRPMGSPRGDFVLLRNTGRGKFVDVTKSSGLMQADDEAYYFPWMSAWGDIDNDGDLDLFIGTWHFYNSNHKDGWSHILSALTQNGRAMLYRNDDGHFVDITESSGIDAATKNHNVIGAAFGDYDQDGWIDLAVTRLYIPGAVLLKNDRGRGFRQDPEGFESVGIGFMTSFVDVNQDGLLDVFVGGIGSAKSVTEQAVFGRGNDRLHTGSRIWLQRKDGWKLLDDYFSRDLPITTMGVNFGDLNHDGLLDWYLGTGDPEGWMIVPNLMYIGKESPMNDPATDNLSMLHGFGTIQKGHGIVFADFDEDGDQDIYSALGGYWPGDLWPNQFFLNQSATDNRWVKIALQGCTSNQYGSGARIRVVTLDSNGVEKSHYYHMDNQTGFGSAPYVADIGLGLAKSIKYVEVTWLGGSPEADRSHRVVRYGANLNEAVILVQNGGYAENRRSARRLCETPDTAALR